MRHTHAHALSEKSSLTRATQSAKMDARDRLDKCRRLRMTQQPISRWIGPHKRAASRGVGAAAVAHLAHTHTRQRLNGRPSNKLPFVGHSWSSVAAPAAVPRLHCARAHLPLSSSSQLLLRPPAFSLPPCARALVWWWSHSTGHRPLDRIHTHWRRPDILLLTLSLRPFSWP